jgi:guanine nucleotide-binding protein G(i) subunit alpha
MIMESVEDFDSIFNSGFFQTISIILLLTGTNLFRMKLAKSPLSNYFPDYSGGNDVERAAKYILWRFNQVNRAHFNIYPCVTEPSGTGNLSLVVIAIKETLFQNSLRDREIIW